MNKPNTTQCDVERMVPVLVRAVTHDRKLSLKARLFGTVLATLMRYRETTDHQMTALATSALGLADKEGAALFAELDGRGYIGRLEEDYPDMSCIPALKYPHLPIDFRKAPTMTRRRTVAAYSR